MSDFAMPKTGSWKQRGGWVVRRLCADLQLSPEQAAGIVGNLGYESIRFTALQEIKPTVAGSRGGYGWAQWTSSRRRRFEEWCSQRHLAPASDEANYGFLVYEIGGDYRSFLARLRQCAGIEDACRLTHKLYETPSDVLDGSYKSGPARLNLAREALAGSREVVDSGTPAEIKADPPATAAKPPLLSTPPRNPVLAVLGWLRGWLMRR